MNAPTKIIPRDLLADIERTLGRFEFAETSRKWVESVAEDPDAMAAGLQEFKDRQAKKHLPLLRDATAWLMAAYLRNRGKKREEGR